MISENPYLPNPAKLVEVSLGLGEPMHGLEAGKLTPEEMLSRRGW